MNEQLASSTPAEVASQERRGNDSLRALAALGQVENMAESHVLFREGESAAALFVILSGLVRTYVAREDGKRYIVSVLGAGNIIGEVGLLGGRRTTSADALTAVRCARIDYSTVKMQLGKDSSLGFELLSLAYERIRHADAQIKSLALETVYQRLRELFANHDGRVDMTQMEISEHLGASRDMVTRIFRDLSQGGYIQTGKGSVSMVKALPRTW